MANPQIVVEYIANTAKLASATGDVEKAGGRVSSTMKNVGGAVAAGLAVGAVVAFGKSAVSAAEESEKATDRLDQVFRSMGDSTGTAAQEAEAYASSLSVAIGVEDEQILAGQAMLATFGKVSNETARTAGIFDRATKAGADLAATGFGSIESNAVQLGKALQDPVKGLAALGRAGVTFTDAQKELIKGLVESGQHLEAQKVVLGAIETQVGGTAAATVSESEKMAVAYGEVQESLGKALLPALEAVMPHVVKLANFIAKNSSVIVPLIAAIAAAAVVIKVITIAQIAWNIAMSANPIGLIILAIAALVVGIILLIKNWDKVKEVMVKAFEVIKKAGLDVFNWLKNNWPYLLGILTGPFGLAVVLIIKNWDKIEDGARAVLATIKSVFNAIAGVITGAIAAVGRAAQRLADAMLAPINAAKGAINAVLGRFNALSIPGFDVSINMPGPVPDVKFGWGGMELPDIPLLAKGGIVTRPTLAMIGERGPEAVLPLSGGAPIEVRVFIGDQELRGMVRTEIVHSDTGLARTLLAGRV